MNDEPERSEEIDDDYVAGVLPPPEVMSLISPSGTGVPGLGGLIGAAGGLAPPEPADAGDASDS